MSDFTKEKFDFIRTLVPAGELSLHSWNESPYMGCRPYEKMNEQYHTTCEATSYAVACGIVEELEKRGLLKVPVLKQPDVSSVKGSDDV